MTHAPHRSMNKELEWGMSDGKYKKIVSNRGGVVEAELLYACRDDLADTYYGIHEVQEKQLPDGTVDPSGLYYMPTKPAGQLGT